MSDSSPSPPPLRGARTAALGFIFAATLINAVSFGIMIPILPNLIKQMAGGDTASASEWNALFSTTWGLMQFLVGPVLGMLSDRYGRRPVLLISIFGLFVDFMVMALAPTLAWLYLGRIFNGMTAASFSTANAYVADITAPDKRARNFGIMGSAFGFVCLSCRNPCRRIVDQPPLTGDAPTRWAHSPSCGKGVSCSAWRAWASCSSSPTPCCPASSCSTPAIATIGRRPSWGSPSWRPARR
jgi:hypothetical protein